METCGTLCKAEGNVSGELEMIEGLFPWAFVKLVVYFLQNRSIFKYGIFLKKLCLKDQMSWGISCTEMSLASRLGYRADSKQQEQNLVVEKCVKDQIRIK